MHAAARDVGATAAAAAATAPSGEGRGDVADCGGAKDEQCPRPSSRCAQRATRQYLVSRAGKRFIVACISHRWRLAHKRQDVEWQQPKEEPPAGALRIGLNAKTFPSGAFNVDAVRLAFLVGLPSSGKSWLGQLHQQAAAAFARPKRANPPRSFHWCRGDIAGRQPLAQHLRNRF
jgi:hypothetical protein